MARPDLAARGSVDAEDSGTDRRDTRAVFARAFAGTVSRWPDRFPVLPARRQIGIVFVFNNIVPDVLLRHRFNGSPTQPDQTHAEECRMAAAGSVALAVGRCPNRDESILALSDIRV